MSKEERGKSSMPHRRKSTAKQCMTRRVRKHSKRGK